jgi:HEAT repeat protein
MTGKLYTTGRIDMRHTFLSYCHEDVDFVLHLSAQLRDAGFPNWMDADLSAGDDWGAAVESRIRDALAVVVVLSPYTAASEHVNFEWAFALGAGVPVVPILLKLSETAMPSRLRTFQFLNFGNHVNRPWNDLTEALRRIAASERGYTLAVPREAPPVVRTAAHTLDSMHAEERNAAILSLSMMNHPAAVEVLAEAVRHPISDVRAFAARKLSDRGDVRALPALLEAALVEGGLISDSVIQLGQPAVPALIAALREGNPRMWRFLIRCLALIGGPDATGEVTKSLHHDDPEVQMWAAEMLGDRRNPQTVPDLRPLLHTANAKVRRAAVEAVAKCGGIAVISDLVSALGDSDNLIRYSAVDQIRKFCDTELPADAAAQIEPVLAGLLNDPYDQVKYCATAGLKNLARNSAAGKPG